MATMRILITGASGSGTSTLGQALAERLSGRLLEADDFFWLSTQAPYIERLERLAQHLPLKTDHRKVKPP